MRILVDCSGGDKAPQAAIEGAVRAAKEFSCEISFIGNPDDIKKYAPESFEIIASEDDITNEDKIDAIKKKKNSSMVLGMKLIKEGKFDAFVSAGNSGALVASATLYAGRLPGVARPALAPVLPTESGCFMLIDAGANLECKPEFLAQFGMMGAIYMQNVQKVARPRVGLLNVGAEEGKGGTVLGEAAEMLRRGDRPRSPAGDGDHRPYEFVGNVEARDFPKGVCDVLVAEGFAGNVMLKSIEGMGLFIKDNLKEAVFGSLKSKIGALFMKKSLTALMNKMDYSGYGGAPMLGVNGAVIKAHGSSNSTAFYHAIRQAVSFVESGVNEKIEEQLTTNNEQ
ncbi:MAG: phosphate acyltransferase PlsX [Oscillospiraceae bacterium]|nr:phosphate acyltransferase PlsX [Oscillospiraceae bacterium]